MGGPPGISWSPLFHGPATLRAPLRLHPLTSFFGPFAGAAVIAFALWPTVSRANQSGALIIQTYSLSDIHHGTQAFSIGQDLDGVMEFGTDDCVMSFDGDHWSYLYIPHGHEITGLEFSADHRRQWVAASNNLGWIEKLPDGTRVYHSLLGSLPVDLRSFGIPWYAAATDNGALFVTDTHVFRWNGSSFRTWTFSTPTRMSLERSGNYLYLDDGTTGLYRFVDDDFHLVVPESTLQGARVIWIQRRSSDWLLVTTHGLLRWDGTSVFPFNPESSARIMESSLSCATGLPENHFALGTLHSGVFIFDKDGRIIEHLTKSSAGTPTDSAFSLFDDREGGLWVSSPDYLYRVSLSMDARFYGRDASPAVEPFSFACGNGKTTILLSPSQAFRMIGPPPEIEGQEIGGLTTVTDFRCVIPFGADWVAAGGVGGLSLFGPSSTRTFPTVAFSDSIYGLAVSDEPNHVFEARATGLWDFDTSTGHLRSLKVKGVENFGDIAIDWKGRLWVDSFPAGIFVIPNPHSPNSECIKASSIYPEFGERTHLDASIRETTDHSLFFVLDSRCYVLPRNAEHLEPVQNWPRRTLGAPVFNTCASALAHDRSLWTIFPAADGMPITGGSISFNGTGVFWHARSIPGLWKVGYPYGIAIIPRTPSDILLVMGSKGVLRVAVSNDTPLIPPVTPIIHALAQLNATAPFQTITGPLPFTTQKVLIDAAAPTFKWRQAVLIQTFVDGVDTTWTTLDSTSRRELTGLREGSYTAHIRTLSDTGLTSPDLAVTFVILPPWWRTFPFVVFVTSALLVAIFSGYRFRIRKLREKASDLESTVAKRTEQLTKARIQAEQANRAKSDFIARVSHNIRNPLNGIVGISLALTDTTLKTEQHDLVETLDSCARQLTTLIDDVLDFSRIEAGKVELRPTPCSPRALFRAIATSLATQASGSRSQIETQIAPSLPEFVMVDAHRLEEILLNFITNALKYAPGHIVLRADKALDAPDVFECSVQDRGPGISQQDQDSLFTSFTQLTQLSRPLGSGTGLGLALCRRLADLMGGTVGVRSVIGFGTRFFVRLPLISAEPVSATPAQLSAGFRFAKALIVEDADYNAWAFAAVLAHTGVRSSDRAKDGHEAIALFQSSTYDVVLLDRNLPDMDGTDVARKLREMEAGRAHTLIICVSAYSTTEDRDNCLAAGMDFFAGKPLTPEKLSSIFVQDGIGLRPASPSQVPAAPDHKASTDRPDSMNLLTYLANHSGTSVSAQVERLAGYLTASIDELRAAVAHGDFDLIKRSAHQVLGHAQFVDAHELAALASKAKLDADAGDIAALPQLVEQIHDEAALMIAYIRANGDRSPPPA
jgi:signal transduction histidine kinase/ActR/RegA family two-component response regulator